MNVLHRLTKQIHNATTDKEKSLHATTLKNSAQLCALLMKTPNDWFQDNAMISADDIEAKIALRHDAKKRKDFPKADDLRDELLDLGIELKDTPTGTSWSVIKKSSS